MAGGLAGSGCGNRLIDNGLGFAGMFFEKFLQSVGHDVVDDPLDFAVAQLRLRLPFELRFPYLDADDSRQAFAHVFTGQVFLLVLQQSRRTAVVVDRTGQAGTEAAQVGAPFFRKDVVDEGQDIFAVAVVVLHGDVHEDLVLFAFQRNDRRVDGFLVFIQKFHEGREAPFVAVDFAAPFAALIRQGNMQALVQEGQLAEARLQRVEIIVRVGENVRVGLKAYLGARFFAPFHGTNFFQRFRRQAPGKGNIPQIPVALDFDLRPQAQGVDDGYADAVQAAGNGIAVAAEFAAGVEHRQYDFDGRLADLMHGYGNAAAVVDDGNAVVSFNRHFNVRAVSCQRFVDTVVDDFIY